MAEITTSVEIIIERSPEYVFEWISDPMNEPQWVSGVKRISWIRKQESESARPEDRWECLYEYGGRENIIVMEVDVSDRREMEFSFHTVEGKYPIRKLYACHRSGNQTLFRMTLTGFSDSLPTAFMFKFMGFMIKPMMRRQYRKEIEKVKVILESLR